MERQADMLALKGKLLENGKTEEALQNFFEFSVNAQLFREAGGFKRR